VAEPVSIVLVGIGGYGEVYLAGLLEHWNDPRFRVVGAVDPMPQKCRRLADLQSRGVSVLPSLEAFYQDQPADLAIISSPIHHHCAHTCRALEHRSHVLCEKPPAATVQDVDRMMRTAERAARWVAVGYQWSFTDSIQRLKRDIQAGLFGAPQRLKTLCFWPRDESYYGRNDWAGRLRSDAGDWILDSPLNNAMAHDLHNALYVLGGAVDTSARPQDVIAELYRANEIENFDTAALRAHTVDGAEILFYGSHAIAEDVGPVFCFEFARAVIEYGGGQSPIVARLNDGSVRQYASPASEPQTKKLWACIRAIAEGTRVPCGLKAARAHTVCVNGSQESVSRPLRFPSEMIRRRGSAPNRLTYADGLADTLRRCYARARLPSELGTSWAQAGRTINLLTYREFPSGSR
jgi:predicted dehydrogenase